jgi:hypothetical protein
MLFLCGIMGMGEEQHIFTHISQSFEATKLCYQLSCNFWVCPNVGQVLEKSPNPYLILTHVYARRINICEFFKNSPLPHTRHQYILELR